MTTRIILHKGCVRDLSLRLKSKRTRNYFDASAATNGVMYVEQLLDSSVVVVPAITLLETATGADWTNGLIVIPIGTSITNVVGTYRCVVTITTATGPRAVMEFLIEVRTLPAAA